MRSNELVDQFQDRALFVTELRHPELRRARALLQPPVALEPVRGAWLATMRRLDCAVGLGVDNEWAALCGFIAVPRYRETLPDRQGATVDDKVGQAGRAQGAAKHGYHTPAPYGRGVRRVEDVEALDR